MNTLYVILVFRRALLAGCYLGSTYATGILSPSTDPFRLNRRSSYNKITCDARQFPSRQIVEVFSREADDMRAEAVADEMHVLGGSHVLCGGSKGD